MPIQWLSDFVGAAKSQMAQYNNSTFRNATMAVCALVAASDGQIEKEEKSKVANLIGKNELLQCFNATELRDLFLQYCEEAVDEFTRLELVNHVRKLRGNAAQADTAMRIACIIANADGDFEEEEKKVVRELCGVLALSSSEYL